MEQGTSGPGPASASISKEIFDIKRSHKWDCEAILVEPGEDGGEDGVRGRDRR